MESPTLNPKKELPWSLYGYLVIYTGIWHFVGAARLGFYRTVGGTTSQIAAIYKFSGLWGFRVLGVGHDKCESLQGSAFGILQLVLLTSFPVSCLATFPAVLSFPSTAGCKIGQECPMA